MTLTLAGRPIVACVESAGATLAAARHRTERAETMALLLEERDDREALEQAVPLTDVDVNTVRALIAGRVDFATHGTPRGVNWRTRTPEAITARRERLTAQGERWLAVHLLHRRYGAPEIAEWFGTTQRAIERTLALDALGWPTGPDAVDLGRDLTPWHKQPGAVAHNQHTAGIAA